MPDFHEFERLLRNSITASSEGDLAPFSQQIANLNDQNRPLVFKGRSSEELAGYLRRAHKSVRSISGSETFTTDDANLDGKDLFAVESDLDIELKSGPAMTDAQSGLGSVAWALGDDNKEELTTIMSESMKSRRKLYLEMTARHEDPMASINQSKSATMDAVYAYFSQKVTVGTEAPARLSHFGRCVALGLTKQKEILAAFDGADSKLPLLLQADWDRGLVKYEKGFDPSERVLVTEISRGTERAKVAAAGEKSGRKMTLYPHYKNSFHHRPSGVSIPAKCWVQTACFHVWID